MSDFVERARGPREVRRALPHRYPFLLVDRVVEVSEDGTRAVAIKNVSANEPFFQGHFPDNPVMPGVLLVEALAQAAGAALLGDEGREGKLAMLAGIDEFRFRRAVVPGDTLRLEVELLRRRSQLGRVRGRALVDGEVAAEGEILFAIVPIPT